MTLDDALSAALARPLCPYREQPLPEVLPVRGEQWRLPTLGLVTVLLVSLCNDRRLSFAFVRGLGLLRNVALHAFADGERIGGQVPLFGGNEA